MNFSQLLVRSVSMSKKSLFVVEPLEVPHNVWVYLVNGAHHSPHARHSSLKVLSCFIVALLVCYHHSFLDRPSCHHYDGGCI
jgi:hypothetical protein